MHGDCTGSARVHGLTASVLDAVKRLKTNKDVLIGGNIGKNKITSNEDAVEDYKTCFEIHEILEKIRGHIRLLSASTALDAYEPRAPPRFVSHKSLICSRFFNFAPHP